MAEFGSEPGFTASTTGASLTGVSVGVGILVLVGRGDTNNGNASPGELVEVTGIRDARNQFGTDSELTEALLGAIQNGRPDELYGVSPTTKSVTTESATGVSSYQLSNVPIVEDISTITVAEDTNADGNYDTDQSVEFRYASPPSTPSNADTAFVNPFTGEVEHDASGDYQYQYDYLEWAEAFTAASGAIDEDEQGLIFAISESETVAADLDTQLAGMRDPNYQMALGFAGAQPNANTSDNDPKIDTANYGDSLDSDTLFLAGPARFEDTTQTILGHLAGHAASAKLDESIFFDGLSAGQDLEQKVTKAEADDLRDQEVIPIRDLDSIEIRDNLSTATATDWERDFFRRRIVDRVILIAKQTGEQVVGRINDGDTASLLEGEVRGELEQLVNARVLEPNSDDTVKWYVDVHEDPTDSDKLLLDIGITTEGVVKVVAADIIVQS